MSGDWAQDAAHDALDEAAQHNIDSAQESAEAADRAHALAEQIQNGR